MGAQLGLPAALAARGLAVEVVPGWQTRSAGSFNPVGAVCHWTAGPARTLKRPSLSICTNGRADLPGPLCNVYLDRNGIAVVVAAGRANHAGAGTWRGATGNSSFFGTECEAAGPDDFTDAQRRAYPLVNAAFCDLGGFGADMVCGHSEYATPRGRKTDVNNYPMTTMRAQVAAILAGPRDRVPTPTTSEEDDMFDAPAQRQLDELTRRVQALTDFAGNGPDGAPTFAPAAVLRQSAEILSVPLHSRVEGSTFEAPPRDFWALTDAAAYRTEQQVAGLSAAVAALAEKVGAAGGASADELKAAVTEAMQQVVQVRVSVEQPPS